MVFSSTKVANIGQQGKQVLLFICIWLYLTSHHSDSSAMTDYRLMFSTSDRHRKHNQLRWRNMSAHLTNETSYWLKKLLMHLNWAIYVCDFDIDTNVCFFPTLSQDRAKLIPLAQPEACPQRNEKPVCARAPHRSRNGYPGCTLSCSKNRCKDSLSTLDTQQSISGINSGTCTHKINCDVSVWISRPMHFKWLWVHALLSCYETTSPWALSQYKDRLIYVWRFPC